MTKILLVIGFLSIRLLCYSQVYDAELIDQQTKIEINNNKLTKDLYFEIKINNRAGEKYTKIVIPFSKLIKLSNLEAFIKALVMAKPSAAKGKYLRKLSVSSTMGVGIQMNPDELLRSA